MKFNLGNLFKGFGPAVAPIDPSRFGDELAKKTSWEPLKRGGTNMRTNKLVQVGANRVEFQMSLGMKLLPIIMMLVFLGIGGWSVYDSYIKHGPVNYSWTHVGLGALLLLFIVGALVFLFYRRRRPVFDKNYGYYWNGKPRKEGAMVDPSQFSSAVRLSEIKALQIIPEFVVQHSSKSTHTFYSYELNLVLESAQRVNVTDHGNLPAMQEDAHLLSQFLSVPVWDASDAAKK
jgi:hypothetical protein